LRVSAAILIFLESGKKLSFYSEKSKNETLKVLIPIHRRTLAELVSVFNPCWWNTFSGHQPISF